jgi:N-acetyl-gamma-glutamyl-phosphate reductase
MHKIFIDGDAGTTGLRIKYLLEPLVSEGKIELIKIADRKDPEQRRACLNKADLSILCLPDEAALEAAEMVEGNEATRVIDASSAQRTNDGWVYGFPELSKAQPDIIKAAKRVTNPGCYATGAVAIIKPLVDAGLLAKDSAPHITGVSGYSGGGKALIADYEGEDGQYARDNALRGYSLNARHKHIAEIKKHAGLSANPVFVPHTVPAYQGMSVTASFNGKELSASLDDIHDLFLQTYDETTVQVRPMGDGTFNFARFSHFSGETMGVDENLYLQVNGWEKDGERQITITALLDNLGKGASAQAIQNLKLMLGL